VTSARDGIKMQVTGAMLTDTDVPLPVIEMLSAKLLLHGSKYN